MNNSEIDKYACLQRLISLFHRVSQISWTSDQTRKRYPAPEVMTDTEIESITRVFLALGLDLEDVYREWKKEYAEYKKNETK